jgi:hypothetical protein
LVAELVPQPVVGIRLTGELIDAGIDDDAMSADGVDDLMVTSVFGVAMLFRATTYVGCSGELLDSVVGVADARMLSDG